MKRKHIFLNIVIILILALAVFFIGWMQFLVKPGYIGVFQSKTSGFCEKPVKNGEFSWKWERLLPTNSTLTSYSLKTYQNRHKISGSLPSSEIYINHISQKADFSYSYEMNISLLPDKNFIFGLAKKGIIKNQEDLDRVMNEKSLLACQKIVDYILRSRGETYFSELSTLSSEDLAEICLENTRDFNGIEISGIEFITSRTPDMYLYNLAKKSFTDYQSEVNRIMKEKASEKADDVIEQDKTIEQLEKFGQLLQKYPQLQELSKSGDITAIINSLRTIR